MNRKTVTGVIGMFGMLSLGSVLYADSESRHLLGRTGAVDIHRKAFAERKAPDPILSLYAMASPDKTDKFSRATELDIRTARDGSGKAIQDRYRVCLMRSSGGTGNKIHCTEVSGDKAQAIVTAAKAEPQLVVQHREAYRESVVPKGS